MTRKRKILREAQAEYRSFYTTRQNAKTEIDQETLRCQRRSIIILLSLIDLDIYDFKISYENMNDYILEKYGFDLNDKPLKGKEESS
ncbi:MAG: hypothetical protein PHU32_05650 [Candidatus ainarchaeum sp.]|nr:hypothetical protein [Clostridia bacterium]MDD3085341.1 hypothetical protein [Candidatus ainarchaeum sp.]